MAPYRAEWANIYYFSNTCMTETMYTKHASNEKRLEILNSISRVISYRLVAVPKSVNHDHVVLKSYVTEFTFSKCNRVLQLEVTSVKI